MEIPRLKVLLIEDDEDDYVLVYDMLSEIQAAKFELKWVTTYEDALQAINSGQFDVHLLDYRLGERDGLELLRDLHHRCAAPVIFLTGQGDYGVDLEAMRAGAADYLVKDQINPFFLERAIRYAIERNRTERQLKFLSAQLLKAQEDERERIARELHDSIGASLSAIKFGAETALTQMEQGSATPDVIKRLVSLVQHAIDESRRIMTDLRPSILDDLGIITTVNWFCRQYQTIYSSIQIDKNLNVEEDDIPEELKITVFRIMQEALHNIAKHSKASLVELSLVKTQNGVDLIIVDDGIGFDSSSALHRLSTGKSLGLISMKERAELSGGHFSIESSPGEGTRIRASWIFDTTSNRSV